MNREQAHEILMKYMKGENYITHSYAVEAIMKGLAKRLAPDEVEYWGIVGLLHDLDEEQCDWQHDLSVHGPTSVEILKKEGTVEFKTDNRGLFEFSLEEVRDSDWNLEVCTFDLHHDEELVKGNVMTEYEEKFSSMGNPICKMVIRQK